MSKIIRQTGTRRPYLIRSWEGRAKREKAFATMAEARAYKTDIDHAARYATGPVNAKAGKAPFTEACSEWLARLACSPRTRATYASTLRSQIMPATDGLSLAQVAADRDLVACLLVRRMAGLSLSRREQARAIIAGTLDEAVRSGKLPGHRCGGIALVDDRVRHDGEDWDFPTDAQVAQVAASVGLAVALMRGCGLRIAEALAVEREDFRDGGRVLRLAGQASEDGRERMPLKDRKPGETRTVPVPPQLWAMIRDLPPGPVCPGPSGSRYALPATTRRAFARASARAGIPASMGFHPHMLRHAYACDLLAARVDITHVARFMGHRSIQVTYETYSHKIPDANGLAAAALATAFATWAA